MNKFQVPRAKDTFGKNSFGLQATTQNWLIQKGQHDRKLWGIPQQYKNVWIVQNKYYDLSNFIQKHPGGSHWLQQTNGHDITQHFHVHHLNQTKARQVLQKYYLGQCPIKNTRFTFQENGIYQTTKKRVMSKFKVQQLQDTSKSKIKGNIFFLTWIFFFLLAGYYESFICSAVCGILLYPLLGIAHNFVHKKPTFYRFLFLTSGFTHRQWQIQHCLSHHAYPNTLLDYQIRAFQPFLYFHHNQPQNKKWVSIPFKILIYTISLANIFLKTFINPLTKFKQPQWLYFIPMSQILILYILNKNILTSLSLFIGMQLVFGIIFHNRILCSHRNQKVWYQGQKQILDFAQHTNAATLDIETKLGQISPIHAFVFNAGFNFHVVHHLFPTIDFHQQHLVYPIVKETFKQFGIMFRELDIQVCRDSVNKNLTQRLPYNGK